MCSHPHYCKEANSQRVSLWLRHVFTWLMLFHLSHDLMINLSQQLYWWQCTEGSPSLSATYGMRKMKLITPTGCVSKVHKRPSYCAAFGHTDIMTAHCFLLALTSCTGCGALTHRQTVVYTVVHHIYEETFTMFKLQVPTITKQTETSLLKRKCTSTMTTHRRPIHVSWQWLFG